MGLNKLPVICCWVNVLIDMVAEDVDILYERCLNGLPETIEKFMSEFMSEAN